MLSLNSQFSNVENLSPQIIRRVAREMNDIATEPPEGIRVVVNDDDVTDIQAVIFGPDGTPYANGQFKVKLVLGKDFPQVPPKAYFLTKIFHPNVSETGEICVNTLKKDWNYKLGIRHILLVIKCLLIVPNPESALNEEAGKLLLEEYEDYSKRAQMMTEIHARNTNEFVSHSNSDLTNGDLKKATKDGGSGTGTSNAGTVNGAGTVPAATDKKLLERKKLLKEKKKTLKRL